MSLDFYLSSRLATTHECECPRCGTSHENIRVEELFSRNITHNVNGYIQAHDDEAYQRLWGHMKSDVAADLLPSLRRALESMESPATHNKGAETLPANKWGTAESAHAFVQAVLRACEEWPNAAVRCSR